VKIKSKVLSVVNENTVEECKLVTIKCVQSYIFVKKLMWGAHSQRKRKFTRERVICPVQKKTSRKHITLLSFRFGNAFARGKDLIFSTCKAQPVLPARAKSRMGGTERLKNPPVTGRYSRQHRCWGSSLYLFHISCKIVGLYAVKYSVSSADGLGTWKAFRGWPLRGTGVMRVIGMLKNLVSEQPVTG